MATIIKRGDLQWQVKIRRKGFPTQSRTFMYKQDAERWARSMEHDFDTTGLVDRRYSERTTLREILERYQQEITPAKRSADIETVKIKVLLRDKALVDLKMSAISSAVLAEWRDRRLSLVSGATVNREMDILSAVINHARREWSIHMTNPIQLVKRPEKARARDRRFSDEEIEYLLRELTVVERGADGRLGSGARNTELAPIMRLAIETAMRRGEILSLRWENVDFKVPAAFLPITKNGDSRAVPLSKKAVAILKEMQGLPKKKPSDGLVFKSTGTAVRLAFTRAVARAQARYVVDCEEVGVEPKRGFLDDVHFHDLRHEATSRMSLKLPNLVELSAVTGHRDIRMLKRYYHPRAADLAKKLD